ncbi:DUF5708 family protein [Streptomyces sp. NPDC052492]|uniref:DUF1427 family protein n=1 Tax=Streptomyces tendae TaxID=1932 RepID=A0ABX5ZM72_STRTE|nr:DUF5708 family protein [Streptomyces tendae]QER85523.1 hypothetical protein F3L20_06205 [Streptomyces tendae]
MNTAHGTLLAGVLTALAGLLLWRYTGGVDLPVVTPSRAGVVLMCVGAAEALLGAFRAVRATQGRPR